MLILFPCNQFMYQEPLSCPDAKSMKKMSTGSLTDEIMGSGYVIMTEKVKVNGAATHPVFEFLKYNCELFNESKELCRPIPWNFSKWLIDPNGGVYGGKHYSNGTTPNGLCGDIDILLSSDSPKSPTRRKTIELEKDRS